MTARRPLDGTTLGPGRSLQCVEKAGKIRKNFVDTLAPHIEKFVRSTYCENSPPEQRLAEDREMNRQMLDGLESEETQAESAELQDEERKLFEGLLQHARTMDGASDEEYIKRALEIDENIIGEWTRGSADEIWRMAINALYRLWKKGGPQSIGIKELMAGLDFAKYIADRISEKYYPEIKEIIIILAPELFKESFMDTGRNGYWEAAYMESTGEIVLREVSWDMVQSWVNS